MLRRATIESPTARPGAIRITRERYEPIRPCREEIPVAIAVEHMEMSEVAPLARHPGNRTARPDPTPGRVQEAARVAHSDPQEEARVLRDPGDPEVLGDRPVETDSPDGTDNQVETKNPKKIL